MTYQLIGGDTSNIDEVVNQINQNIAQLKVQDTTNIFKDDAGTRRVLLGKGKDGFYGLKVSQAGADVYDGSDEDMIFDSDNNIFKIASTGTATINPPASWAPGAAGKQTVTIAHNLGYKPAVLVYVDNPVITGVSDYGDGLAMIPNPLFILTSYYTVIQSNARVDDTNLYIDLVFLNQAGTNLAGANPYSWMYRYYILTETAAVSS